MADDAIEQARRWFAEELRLVARVNNTELIEAFATARRAPTTVLRTVPLPHSAFAPWGRRGAGAFPPLRVSAGEGGRPIARRQTGVPKGAPYGMVVGATRQMLNSPASHCSTSTSWGERFSISDAGWAA